MGERAINTSVPVSAVIGSILWETLLEVIITLVLLWRMDALTPLDLLQENKTKKTQRKIKVANKTAPTIAPQPENIATHAGIADNKTAPYQLPRLNRKEYKHRAARFMIRYTWKHIRCAAGKSASAILVVALLFFAVGQYVLVRQSYFELINKTIITAKFFGGLELHAVPLIKQNSFVDDCYYEASETVDLNFNWTNIVFTNDLARYTGSEVVITYADGYDATCMETFDRIIIAGRNLMDLYGLQPGDTVIMTHAGALRQLQSEYIYKYRAQNPDDVIDDAAILAKYDDEISQIISLSSHTYTIAGVITTPYEVFNNSAFAPGHNGLERIFGKDVKLM